MPCALIRICELALVSKTVVLFHLIFSRSTSSNLTVRKCFRCASVKTVVFQGCNIVSWKKRRFRGPDAPQARYTRWASRPVTLTRYTYPSCYTQYMHHVYEGQIHLGFIYGRCISWLFCWAVCCVPNNAASPRKERFTGSCTRCSSLPSLFSQSAVVLLALLEASKCSRYWTKLQRETKVFQFPIPHSSKVKAIYTYSYFN